MQLNAIYLYAPLVCSLIQDDAELRVDGVARGERLVELQLANHITQGCLRKLLDGVGEVVNLVNRLHGVNNLEVEQRIDCCGNIILRNHALLVEVVDLLAEVDAGRLLDYGILATIYDHLRALRYLACAVDDGQQVVYTRLKRAVVAAQALHNAGLGLWNNLNAFEYIYHRDKGDDKKYG